MQTQNYWNNVRLGKYGVAQQVVSYVKMGIRRTYYEVEGNITKLINIVWCSLCAFFVARFIKQKLMM